MQVTINTDKKLLANPHNALICNASTRVENQNRQHLLELLMPPHAILATMKNACFCCRLENIILGRGNHEAFDWPVSTYLRLYAWRKIYRTLAIARDITCLAQSWYYPPIVLLRCCGGILCIMPSFC